MFYSLLIDNTKVICECAKKLHINLISFRVSLNLYFVYNMNQFNPPCLPTISNPP